MHGHMFIKYTSLCCVSLRPRSCEFGDFKFFFNGYTKFHGDKGERFEIPRHV